MTTSLLLRTLPESLVAIGLLATAIPLRADFAPESIAGTVYRYSYYNASLRSEEERTIIYGGDGRYVFLKYASRNFVADYGIQAPLLETPPQNGSYTYAKTGPDSAVVTRVADGATLPGVDEPLDFTAPGTGRDPSSSINPRWVWTLTNATILELSPALNISTRGTVSAGAPIIVGFVVPGSPAPDTGFALTNPHVNQRDVLIRAVGPSLTDLGVQNVWADPDFTVHTTEGQSLPRHHIYRDWTRHQVPLVYLHIDEPAPEAVAGFEKIFAYTGAFPLQANSKDAAAVLRLAPGAYTVIAGPAAGAPGGEVLVEVYFLP